MFIIKDKETLLFSINSTNKIISIPLPYRTKQKPMIPFRLPHKKTPPY